MKKSPLPAPAVCAVVLASLPAASLAVVLATPHAVLPAVPLAAQEPGLQTMPVDPLVEVDWLLSHIGDEDVVVVEAERRPGEFADEHIAGARPLRFQDITWEGDEGWVVEFPEVDEMVDALRAAGIRRDSKVVIYGTSMTATARTWVTFDFLGLGDRAFLLNGGIADWKAAGGPVESGEAPPVERGDVVANAPVDFRVSADWVHERLDDPEVALLDARPDDEYTGTDGGLGGTVNPGHIPGAAQLYWEELMDPANNTRFLPRDRITRILERHGAGAGRTGARHLLHDRNARQRGLHGGPHERPRHPFLRRQLARLGSARRPARRDRPRPPRRPS